MSDPNFLLTPRRLGVSSVVPGSPDSPDRRRRRCRSPDVEEVGDSVLEFWEVSWNLLPGLSGLVEVDVPTLLSEEGSVCLEELVTEAEIVLFLNFTVHSPVFPYFTASG